MPMLMEICGKLIKSSVRKCKNINVVKSKQDVPFVVLGHICDIQIVAYLVRAKQTGGLPNNVIGLTLLDHKLAWNKIQHFVFNFGGKLKAWFFLFGSVHVAQTDFSWNY